MEKEMYLWTQIEVEVINMRTKITPHRLIQMQRNCGSIIAENHRYRKD